MINGLTINPEVFASAHRDCFVVTLQFMLGDGDVYPKTSVELETEEQVIALKNLFDHGKFGGAMEGYIRDPRYKALSDVMGDEDAMCDIFTNDPDGWGKGRFDAFSVLWYDLQGLPHAVDFWWKD